MLLLTKNTGQEAGGQQQTMLIRDVWPRGQASKSKKNGHIHHGEQHHQGHDCGRQCVECFEPSLISDGTRVLLERLLAVCAGVIPAAQDRAIDRLARTTTHLERFNNTLRQRGSPLVRETLSFSKNLVNHLGAIKMSICPYNLLKVAV
jgi:hypothetical protein